MPRKLNGDAPWFAAGLSRRCLPGPSARIVLFALVSLLSTACLQASGAADDVFAQPTGKLTVFAAISLSEAFAEIATEFERDNRGVSVELNLAKAINV